MLPYHTPYVRILSFCFYNRDPVYDSNYYSPICWELTLNKRLPKHTFTPYLDVRAHFPPDRLVAQRTMKLAIFAASLASVGAFAPATKPTFNTALASYENELGVIAPTGYWGTFP